MLIRVEIRDDYLTSLKDHTFAQFKVERENVEAELQELVRQCLNDVFPIVESKKELKKEVVKKKPKKPYR